MDSFELKIPDYYILKKDDGREQIVKLYQKSLDKNNNTIYHGYYGINSYHEIVSHKNNTRALTDNERKLFSEKKYWSLPQQFYHSFPNN